ncbi:unnamed protein product [Protopolystoma xenopodis]|uniref:Uncharacterized protein n=1 Tax=Protopolystoma xenopodis TaxID=117903 RepID=A0A448XJ04_9PLAT|nr:unnamed protein product [Protopolystoma xenopodis]
MQRRAYVHNWPTGRRLIVLLAVLFMPSLPIHMLCSSPIVVPPITPGYSSHIPYFDFTMAYLTSSDIVDSSRPEITSV